MLVATPGRLNDLCNQGHIDLTGIETFVLDEADRMLDMGFIHDVRKVIARLPKKRQTLLFSATFPPNLQAMLPSILRVPYFRVEVGKALSKMRDETAIRQVGASFVFYPFVSVSIILCRFLRPFLPLLAGHYRCLTVSSEVRGLVRYRLSPWLCAALLVTTGDEMGAGVGREAWGVD